MVYNHKGKGNQIETIHKIYCGDDFVIALSTQGSIYGWGNNSLSQLGLKHSYKVLSPVKNPFMKNVLDISVGIKN